MLMDLYFRMTLFSSYERSLSSFANTLQCTPMEVG